MALRSELEEDPLALPIDEEFPLYRDRFETEKQFRETAAVWPKCPQCGKRRMTRCPICHTAGNVFPLGDPDFWNAEVSQTTEENEERHCAGCARCKEQRLTYDEKDAPSLLENEIFPGVPSPKRLQFLANKTSDVFDDLADEREDVDEERAEIVEFRPPVVCPTCSEAFDPVFLRSCEWCGYDFGDGEDFDAPLVGEEDADIAEFIQRKEEEDGFDDVPNESRLKWTIVALVLLGAAILGYFSFVL